jgi:oxalate decarboxylase
MLTVENDPALKVAGSRHALALATALTTIAGFVDAVGYVNLGQFYLSFMSGNTTRLGMALAGGDDEVVVIGLTVVLVFVVGSFVGSLLAFQCGEAKILAIVGGEIICFGAAYGLSVLGIGHLSLVPVAMAMGMQNAIHQTVSGADAGKSFITGALFGVGNGVARVVIGRGNLAQPAVHAASWLAFSTGVVLGAGCLSRFGLHHALILAPVMLSVIAVVAFPRRH